LRQLFCLTAKSLQEVSDEGVQLVPLLISVQRLTLIMQRRGLATLAPTELVALYVNEEFEGAAVEMLLQACELRALIILVDGIDEAGGLREQIEDGVIALSNSGFRVVVTSRPEGVQLAKFQGIRFTTDSNVSMRGFMIMNLRKLNTAQQSELINKQLRNGPQAAFYNHLFAFSNIRKTHDEIYQTKAFPSRADRIAFEGCNAPDQLYLPDRKERNPDKRQKARDGDKFLRVSSSRSPSSAHLQELCAKFTAPVLDTFDLRLAELFDDADKQTV
jgi:hypothetical protein